MKFCELLQTARLSSPDYYHHQNLSRPRHMPPVDTSQLSIPPMIGTERTQLRTPVEGEQWNILQVQGRKGRIGYRMSTGIHWPSLLARRLKQYAEHHDAEVRHLTCTPFNQVSNVTEARALESVKKDTRKSSPLFACVFQKNWGYLLPIFKETHRPNPLRNSPTLPPYKHLPLPNPGLIFGKFLQKLRPECDHH